MAGYDDEYFEGVGICNDYMFREVFRRDPGLAGRLVACVLERPVRPVSYLDDNHELKQTFGAHGSTLDVYVRMDDGSLANVEMQDYRERALALRMRAHLSAMDRDALPAGRDRSLSAWASSVFVCTKDHVGDGRRKHTAHWRLEEVDACVMTRQEMVILYAGGRRGEVSPQLDAFLRYVAGYTGEDVLDDPFVRELDEAVREVRRDNTWREGFVTVQEKLETWYNQGLEQGASRERERIARLLQARGMSAEEARDLVGVADPRRREAGELPHEAGGRDAF